MKLNSHQLLLGTSAENLDELLLRADALGFEAQNNLGVLYATGGAFSQDYQAAVICFRKAAEKGYPPAQINLARMYAQGRGLPQDELEAVKWLHRAAIQGDAGAQYHLGLTLHRRRLDSPGAGLNEAKIEGFMWLQLASGQGFHNAASACDQLNLKMSNAELEEGKRRVARFVPVPE